MIMTCLLAFAEFECNMIWERTQAEYYERAKQGDIGVRAAARELGISMRTWYRLAEVA